MKELIERAKAVITQMEEAWAAMEEVRDAKVDEVVQPVEPETAEGQDGKEEVPAVVEPVVEPAAE